MDKNIPIVKPCDDHYAQKGRVDLLETKFNVVEENTQTVNKLSTKVSLLLTITSFIIMIVTSAAAYTFTGLSDFKDTYRKEQLMLHESVAKLHKEDREQIIAQIKDISETLDTKINDLNKKVIILETTNSLNERIKK